MLPYTQPTQSTSSSSSSVQLAPSAIELHLLYVLLDSNLPTGGFVSSSGLESYAKHGFFTTSPPKYHTSSSSSSSSNAHSSSSGSASGLGNGVGRKRSVAEGVTEFAWAEVGNYASTTGGFVGDAWGIVNSAIQGYRTLLHKRKNERARARARAVAVGIATRRNTGSLDDCGESGLALGMQSEKEMEEENQRDKEALVDTIVEKIQRLDRYHESTLLSHVGRRASRSQGVAMLTLYTRGLSRPPGAAFDDYASNLPHCNHDQIPIDHHHNHNHDHDHEQTHGLGLRDDEIVEHSDGENEDEEQQEEELAQAIVDRYKKVIRKGEAPGHLAVCWGVMTAALGLNVNRAIHIHLFLHARSLLSSAVRLNLIGPYLSSQLLLHPFRYIIEHHVASLEKRGITTCIFDDDPTDNIVQGVEGTEADGSNGVTSNLVTAPNSTTNQENNGPRSGNWSFTSKIDGNDDDFWAWTYEAERGPSTTWPLGEVLMGRHDLQHSRIFNS